MAKKTCLVTGGNSGLGKTSSILLQKASFQVYAGDITEKNNECLISAGVTPLFLDVTDYESVSESVRSILATEDCIDIL
ncbi:MAG TPA: SDR family NAD(P)-dependent oxidoreductase, partial [Clostridiaceae bacterium]|nr:SDR family NAD(P)-dependent oxidoreductase [Clostridiaceae bacterium]